MQYTLSEEEYKSLKRRSECADNLYKAVQSLKNRHVCVLQHIVTDTIQVVSIENVDNYLTHGWIKLACPCGDDEFIIN